MTRWVKAAAAAAATVMLLALSVPSASAARPAGFDLTPSIRWLYVEGLNTTGVNGTKLANILVDEGCLMADGPPIRKLLRFGTTIKNVGDEDLVIGLPPHNRTAKTTHFEWSEAHRHWHYRDYATYDMLLPNGTSVGVVRRPKSGPNPDTLAGQKTGFCVMDTSCNRPGAKAKYECCNMGITAGCQDTYHSGLSCQWIDISHLDVRAAIADKTIFTLVVRVNPYNLLGEANTANNEARIRFTFEELDRLNLFLDDVEELETPAPMYYAGQCKKWIDKDDAVNPNDPIPRRTPRPRRCPTVQDADEVDDAEPSQSV